MTIFALSSAPGAAGVALFRISGPGAKAALSRLTGRKSFRPNEMFFTKVKDGAEVIDAATAVFFRAPRSYTGEDSAEIITHGSAAVASAMYAAMGRIPGLRLARPGEFTRRAFENGKLDLAEVGAVADLIAAQTEAERRRALSVIDGGAARKYAGLRAELAEILAFAEAAIDFAEDELPPGIERQNAARIRGIIARLAAELKAMSAARLIRDGFSVAIVGRTNVGKSSLFNRMAGAARAIVSPSPGTTRDVVEASLDIGGFRVRLLDTAGLRGNSRDKIERAGIRLAKNAAEAADIRIFVGDRAGDFSSAAAKGADTICVFNKIDRAKGAAPAGAVPVSAKTGEGYARLLSALLRRIRAMAAPGMSSAADDYVREALQDCLESLRLYRHEREPALRAEHVRAAAGAIGRITGEIRFAELLDRIFSRFCLGK
ncbi:MAG: tRNA uridine-5-carboxymethylaminomethyl(34) synthesis GTPase MnmE [Rickettsiales bacterium]|jgi:tRNA modification GTPase|nr:tRNA uridine-5-carboxymethylaminomethyl(34) synthesis GTPase MnmE [Rickettsiales bacterium]